MRTGHGNKAALAWAGWGMRVPADWRPLDIQGGWRRGTMVIGDADQPLLQVKWWRPRRKRFDADRWIRRKARHGQPVEDWEDFPVAAKLRKGGRGRRAGRQLWYAYSPEARLAIQLVVGASLPEARAREIDRRVLPSLRTSAVDEPTRWAVFGVSFVSPADMVYRASRLNVGDMVLCVTGSGGRRALMRQVYPAGLALSRQSLDDWIAQTSLRERRRTHLEGRPRSWSRQSAGRTLKGVLQTGRKGLPAPLGFIGRRRTVAVAVVDSSLDRLLLATCDGRREPDESVLADLIDNMNWARSFGPDAPDAVPESEGAR